MAELDLSILSPEGWLTPCANPCYIWWGDPNGSSLFVSGPHFLDLSFLQFSAFWNLLGWYGTCLTSCIFRFVIPWLYNLVAITWHNGSVRPLWLERGKLSAKIARFMANCLRCSSSVFLSSNMPIIIPTGIMLFNRFGTPSNPSEHLLIETTATTRHTRKYTAISALQERNITAVLKVLIAWRSKISEQCLKWLLLGAVRQLNKQYIYKLESVAK